VYLPVTSAANPSALSALSNMDTALQTSLASPGVSAGMTGMGIYSKTSKQAELMEFYPPPYGFAANVGNGSNGHDCGCGGTCVGCGGHGMGQDTSSLFASGFDISGWGWPEWSIVGFGAFAVWSAVANVASAGRSVGSSVRKSRRRSAKKAALQQELGSL